jgi:hypothetical protein
MATQPATGRALSGVLALAVARQGERLRALGVAAAAALVPAVGEQADWSAADELEAYDALLAAHREELARACGAARQDGALTVETGSATRATAAATVSAVAVTTTTAAPTTRAPRAQPGSPGAGAALEARRQAPAENQGVTSVCARPGSPFATKVAVAERREEEAEELESKSAECAGKRARRPGSPLAALGAARAESVAFAPGKQETCAASVGGASTAPALAGRSQVIAIIGSMDDDGLSGASESSSEFSDQELGAVSEPELDD